MSRIQDHLILAYAPLAAFQQPGDQSMFKSGALAESMEDLTTSGEKDHFQHLGVSVLYEEYTPDSWINVSTLFINFQLMQFVSFQYHDNLHFLQSNSDGDVEFLWISGKSGFYHLYHVTSSMAGQIRDTVDGGRVLAPVVRREIQLTSGDWDVRRKCQVSLN